MRKKAESGSRSDDHPRPQREIGRPTMPDSVSVVVRACTMRETDIRDGHGGMARRVGAWFCRHEGLLRLPVDCRRTPRGEIERFCDIRRRLTNSRMSTSDDHVSWNKA
jgi:hypothetical protein